MWYLPSSFLMMFGLSINALGLKFRIKSYKITPSFEFFDVKILVDHNANVRYTCLAVFKVISERNFVFDLLVQQFALFGDVSLFLM